MKSLYTDQEATVDPELETKPDAPQALALDTFDADREWFLASANPLERADLLSRDIENQKAVVADALARYRIQESRISPAGAFPHIPALLDQRRRDYSIVDRCFTHHSAKYDMVLVHQIDQFEDADVYHGSTIVKTDRAVMADRLEASRCIIVSAGLKAYDELRSHGMDLGHIVYLGKHTPLRLRVDVINGKPEHLLMVHAGDLFDSEDTAQALINGDLKVGSYEDENGVHRHAYLIRDPKSTREEPVWSPPMIPLQPWISEDV